MLRHWRFDLLRHLPILRPQDDLYEWTRWHVHHFGHCRCFCLELFAVRLLLSSAMGLLAQTVLGDES